MFLHSRSVHRAVAMWIPVLGLVIGGWPRTAAAQTTAGTGSIQGFVFDPKSEPVDLCAITIVNQNSGAILKTATDESGIYISGALLPGIYRLRAETKGFKAAERLVAVHVGVVTQGDLSLSQSAEAVSSERPVVHVNTGQATVAEVVPGSLVGVLPLNGRILLDAAQLEPGTQFLDGASIGASKAGLPSVSLGGREASATQVEVDGLNAIDQVAGGPAQNLPASAVRELQVVHSLAGLYADPTAAGAVNIVTRTGSNEWHGEGFYFVRDQSVDANLPGASSNPFRRNQYGGRVGGPISPNRLFFFLAGEHTQQDLTVAILPAGPLQGQTGKFSSPFTDTQGAGRIDWQVKPENYRFFYRFSYSSQRDTSTAVPNSYQVFTNSSHAPENAVGLDFTSGRFVHSLRAGFTHYSDGVADAVARSGAFNPAPGIELAIGADPRCATPGMDMFCSGPSALAPQRNLQSNYQVRYDGSRIHGLHAFHFGVGYNHLQSAVLANDLGNGPAVSAPLCDATCQLRPGGASNPLNYTAVSVTLGNGRGFLSPTRALGLAGGGLGPNHRLTAYLGDTWKYSPSLTVTLGTGYVRDTGRIDSDLAPVPCSAINPSLGVSCSGNLLDLLGARLGNAVRQPNLNLSPQLGLAWDPSHEGRTAIRAGIGLFYANTPWSSTMFDRAARLRQGALFGLQPACVNGVPIPVPMPGTGTTVTPTFCDQPIGSVAASISSLQSQYQSAVAASGATNPVFLGNVLASAPNATGTSLLAPDYKAARSVQISFGIEQELRRGLVFSLDYLRSVGTHNLVSMDANHVGDARFFNSGAALLAVNHTVVPAGCPAATSIGSSSQASITCYLATVPTAKIADFAAHGLDSANAYCGGLPCALVGKNPAAFAGVNGNLGINQLLFPTGRSLYTALHATLRQEVHARAHGVRDSNLLVSYDLSKYLSNSIDSGFVNIGQDSISPARVFGPNGLDRRHQFSFAGTVELAHSVHLGLISHLYSPLPVTLTVPVTGRAGGIFTSDLSGDGTGDGSSVSNGALGDLLPATNLGAFGRSVSATQLTTLIEQYNSNNAGQLTPAGNEIASTGLISQNQLVSLGAVQKPIPTVPSGQVQNGWLRTLDLNLSWTYMIKDRIALEPGVSFFNVGNFANFGGPSNPLSGILNGLPGSVNGTPSQIPYNRVGLGTGVFAMGAPRQMEFSMRISF
jgi:hypothetical protein